MLLLISVIVLCIFQTEVQALKCYTCSTTENDIDQRCISDPTTVQGTNIIDCNKNYCTTTRVEYLDPRGKVASMERNCVDKPTFLNDIVEDATFRIYFTSCQTDLCNGGSGKDTSKGGLIGDVGDAIVLLVPGIGVNSALSFSCCTFLTINTAIFMIYFS